MDMDFEYFQPIYQEDRFHNIYNPAYQVDVGGNIKSIDLDYEYESFVQDYRSYDRSRYYKHTELLTRKQALEQAILVLEKIVEEYKKELELC